jgi:hypothetical protein
MFQPAEKPQKFDSSSGEEKNARYASDSLTVFIELKQNVPDVYRHILGIARAFLKKP